MGQSALVLVIDAAESIVGEHRRTHDPVAAQGVPAHVTILFPFPSEVDPDTEARIRSVAATVEPFDLTFRRTDRFPGAVLYLVPEPDDEVRMLMRMAVDRFPDHPPYDGEVADPTPHLTIGMALDDATADSIADQVQARLPLSTRVERLTMLHADDDGRWTPARSWPLGRPVEEP